MIGTVLSNRYKIIEKIGEGGMALVFKARDSLLGRIVAVKVLRPQFASDEEFVERFRREAMSAASLSHPNVVNIYDVGQDQQTYFIVMEYVDGENLKDIIRARSPLAASEAVSIARQMVEALAHAHRHDIVHRDVKPHNILVTREGRVKVTDFGIARAASLSTLTQTGMVMGSVHYFSPEQARGSATGTQSDLYSAGVVLYEMVTGTVPFKGDTPISVALAHIQSEAPAVRALSPDTPVAVERIIAKALSKDLDKRYESAEAMLRDLQGACDQLRDASYVPDMEATRVVERADVAPGRSGSTNLDEATLVRGETQRGKSEPPRGAAGKAIAIVVVCLLVLGLAGAYGLKLLFNKPEVAVPKLTGLSYSKAVERAHSMALIVVRDDEAWDSQIAAGRVISQQPPAGRIVKTGRHILVVVSRGPERAQVPDLVGQTIKDAQNLLTESDLLLGKTDEEFSDEVAAGSVISQAPAAAAKMPKGGTVNVVVSSGPEPSQVQVPNFVGLTLTEVEAMVRTAGLALGKVVPEPSDTVDSGIILEQSPEPDTAADRGTAVNLVVSSGPEGGAAGDPAGATGQSGDTHSFKVEAVVPPGGGSQEVRIVVTDDLGTRVVYRKTHEPGDKVTQVVDAHGSGSIKVYVGGQLARESTI